jgi:hypothetical protein
VSLGLLASLALAGCTQEAEPAQQRVAGTLRMTGGPLGVAQPGVHGEVVFASGDRREVVEAAKDGSFATSLDAGTYTVTGTSPLFGGGAGVCRADAPVVVAGGSIDDVVVACPRR